MKQIKASIEGNIGIIKFYNPPYNFMTSQMVRELDELTRNWENNKAVRAIIITGGLDDIFITHYDIADIQKMFRPMQLIPSFLQPLTNLSNRLIGSIIRGLDKVQPLGHLFEKLLLKTPLFGIVELECIHRIFNRLQYMNKVVIAAVNGDALGGATELLLACDYRLIAKGDLHLGLPEITAAIVPGAGGSQRLARLLGSAKALELMLDGTQLSPREALAYGLVNKVVAKQDLLDEAMLVANKMAKRPPISIKAIKKSVHLGASKQFHRGLEVEKQGFYATGSSNDAVLGLGFMQEKFAEGFSDSEILQQLKSGDDLDFDGR